MRVSVCVFVTESSLSHLPLSIMCGVIFAFFIRQNSKYVKSNTRLYDLLAIYVDNEKAGPFRTFKKFLVKSLKHGISQHVLSLFQLIMKKRMFQIFVFNNSHSCTRSLLLEIDYNSCSAKSLENC